MIKMIKEGVVLCNLKRIRQKTGYSQAVFAHRMQTDRHTISRIEREKTIPSVKFALQLADHFEIKVEELFQLVSDDD